MLDASCISPLSTKPENLAVAPSRAAFAVSSYEAAASWAAAAAAFALLADSFAVAAAELAAFLASSAVWAALLAVCATSSALAAASVAGFCNNETGTDTSSFPLTAGSELTPFSDVTSSSSCTPWLSALIALRTCCMSSCDIAIIMQFYIG